MANIAIPNISAVTLLLFIGFQSHMIASSSLNLKKIYMEEYCQILISLLLNLVSLYGTITFPAC